MYGIKLSQYGKNRNNSKGQYGNKGLFSDMKIEEALYKAEK